MSLEIYGEQGKPGCNGFPNITYFSKEEKIWSEYKKSFQDLGPRLIKIDDQEEQVCLLYYIRISALEVHMS